MSVRAAILVVLLTLSVLLVGSSVEPGHDSAAGVGSTTSVGATSATSYSGTDRSYLGGIVGYNPVQSVGGRAYWASFCPTNEPCLKPEGVAYVPQANAVVLTEVNSTPPVPGPNGTNAVMEFDPLTLRATAPLGDCLRT